VQNASAGLAPIRVSEEWSERQRRRGAWAQASHLADPIVDLRGLIEKEKDFVAKEIRRKTFFLEV
jgi:hypothetical protein